MRKYLDASSAANTRRAHSGAMAGKLSIHALKVRKFVDDVDTRGGWLTITIRRSKTNQDGSGLYKVLLELPDKTLCSLTANRAWLSAAEIRTGPVFRSIDRWEHTRAGQMNGQEVARIVQGTCKRAGIAPSALLATRYDRAM